MLDVLGHRRGARRPKLAAVLRASVAIARAPCVMKRQAEEQLTKDKAGQDGDGSDGEPTVRFGEMPKASAETLAKRKIFKASVPSGSRAAAAVAFPTLVPTAAAGTGTSSAASASTGGGGFQWPAGVKQPAQDTATDAALKKDKEDQAKSAAPSTGFKFTAPAVSASAGGGFQWPAGVKQAAQDTATDAALKKDKEDQAKSATPSTGFKFTTGFQFSQKDASPASKNGKDDKEDAKDTKDEKKVGGDDDDAKGSATPSKMPKFSFSFGTKPISTFPAMSFGSTSPGAASDKPTTFGINTVTAASDKPVWGRDVPMPKVAPGAVALPKPVENTETKLAADAPTAMPELKEPLKTGEEGETTTCSKLVKLYALGKDGDGEEKKWKERGVGQLKVNVDSSTKKARVVQRVKGSGRLIANLPLFAKAKFDLQGEKAVTFAAIEDGEIVSFLLRCKTAEDAVELRAALEAARPAE